MLLSLVTEEQLNEWAREDAPRIAARFDEPFLVVPPVEVRPEELAAKEEFRAAEATGLHPPWTILDGLTRDGACYTTPRQRIVVLGERVTHQFGAMQDEGHLLARFLRRVVDHELIHALFDQRAGAPSDNLLQESAADRVASALNPDPRLQRLSAALLGTDSLSSRDPHDWHSLAYGLGTRFLDRVQRQAGWAAVWAAVLDPPAPSVVGAVVDPTLAVSWRDPTAIESGIERLLPGADPVVTHTSASEFLGRLDPNAVEPQWLFGGDGGLVVTGSRDDATLQVVVLHIEDPARVRRWFAKRAERVHNGRAMTPFPTTGHFYGWSSGPYPPLVGFGPPFALFAQLGCLHPGRDLGLPTHCARAEPLDYREVWSVHAGRVLGLTWARTKVSPRRAREEVEAISSADPPDRLPESSWPAFDWPTAAPPTVKVSARWLTSWIDRWLADGQSCAPGPKRWLDEVADADRRALAPRLERCAAAP